jgi:hypothetical protein
MASTGERHVCRESILKFVMRLECFNDKPPSDSEIKIGVSKWEEKLYKKYVTNREEYMKRIDLKKTEFANGFREKLRDYVNNSRTRLRVLIDLSGSSSLDVEFRELCSEMRKANRVMDIGFLQSLKKLHDRILEAYEPFDKTFNNLDELATLEDKPFLYLERIDITEDISKRARLASQLYLGGKHSLKKDGS